jgi:phosphate transport system substrate-binding protein
MKAIKKIGRKLVKNAQAVSPIIATLMLVLVAVGSAGAFYMWQTGWQSDVEGKAGSADVKASLSIGGSSTVYEFTAIAKEIFEASNPNYKIDLQKGGSGAGIAAAGMGLVDIGAASKDASSSFVDYPDLNRDNKKDLGVEMIQTTVGYDGVVVVVDADQPDLTEISRATLETIYESVYNGVPVTWDTIDTNLTGTTQCASTNAVNTYDRSDESGTEECFCAKLMDKDLLDASKQMPSGYCTFSFGSNQELVAALADDTDGIGFTAWGISENTPGIRVIPFSEDGANLCGDDADGLPSATEIKSNEWPGSRPLNFLTVGKPTGAAKVFIDFCLTPKANLDMCELSDYVSLYA